MDFFKSYRVWFIMVILFFSTLLSAKMVEGEQESSRNLDLTKYHNVGNIWLRVSNYGFFGSGDQITPRWPSLEYPGGSGVDYLYQGALWFGAKKERRNSANQKLYWAEWPPNAQTKIITANDSLWTPDSKVIVDTLVTVGFDGDASLFEFLPAYNPLERNLPQYTTYNMQDQVITASIRNNRRGFDDDGDGLIDEDPVGHAFPFRASDELPTEFSRFGSLFIHNLLGEGTAIINDNPTTWYPLGFQDLSYIDPSKLYIFAAPHDDDGDGLVDEDGAPVSEQDYIGFYYDYSPFGTAGQRDYGGSASGNDHVSLNIRVRQMSYHWSYDYIQNIVYIEFNITNMNSQDVLYDCAMGIYMDADVGPQSFSDTDRAKDDKSGYVRGTDYEFAFTFDGDFDSGLTPGYLGARVCTPDPEQLDFSCWYWKVGDGPDDDKPINYFNLGAGRKTANEKYYLLTGRNPRPGATSVYKALRDTTLLESMYIQDNPVDTRFLFGFFGDMNGYDNPTEDSWNLKPKNTMKIVIAVFPGNDIEDLKDQAKWAKQVYKNPQQLNNVVKPDTEPHYEPPEPPTFPKMYTELSEDNNNSNIINLDVYWDNRSEFFIDTVTVADIEIGWNNKIANNGTPANSNKDHIDWSNFPDEYKPQIAVPGNKPDNDNAFLNPLTGFRIRHDFQGYSLWGRSGKGDSNSWMLYNKWDKKDTVTDADDYTVNAGTELYKNYGGDLGIDRGLPSPITITNDNYNTWKNAYILDENYIERPIQVGDTNYGNLLYNNKTRKEVISLAHGTEGGVSLTQQQREDNQMLFAHEWFVDPNQSSLEKERRRKIYLSLVDDSVIPLPSHGGQNKVEKNGGIIDNNSEETVAGYSNRMARRYYTSSIPNLPKGREFYVSVTAWDRGLPSKHLGVLESGRDANMEIHFPGPSAKKDMNNIYVVPNPYRGSSLFDGRIEGDTKGDKSRRLWFVNLPERCNVQIYTLAGDLVDEFEHTGSMQFDIISISKAANQDNKFEASGASGIHPWNLLSKNNQIVASGLYFFSVKCHDTGNVKVGKFAIIR